MALSRKITIPLVTMAIGLALYASSLYSYPLFHSLVELISIVIAGGIFVVAWNTRNFSPNPYLLFIGIACLYVAFLDLIHTLGYKGMGVFTGGGANLSTQLWICGRYLQSISLLVAPFFIGRKLKILPVFILYSLVTAGLLLSIYFGLFPDAFIEGTGLTLFKITSEYVISLILVAAILYLWTKKEAFDKPVLKLLLWSIVTTIAAEMAFTLYTDVYGFLNTLGHYFKLASCYLIYVAIIRTNLIKPYEALGIEIADRKQADENLREAHDRLYTVLNSVDALICAADMDSHEVLFVNEMVKNVFGDITGKICWQTIQQGQTGPCPFCTSDRLIGEDGEPCGMYNWQFQNTINGRWYDCRDRGLRWMDGRRVRLEIATDITELKVAQERAVDLAAIVEESLNEIYIFDAATLQFIEVNEGARLNIGYTMEELRALTPLDLKPDFTAESFAQLLAPLKSGQEKVLEFTTEHRRKDGSRYPVEVHLQRMSYGALPVFVAIILNISERRKVEEELTGYREHLEEQVKERTVELEVANTRLKEIDRLKSMFIASMSHELRTPLNSVIGFSSILINEWVGPLNDEQKKNLTSILRSGKHLLSLINDVIDVSKIEAGMIEVSREDFDLAEVLTEVEETFAKEAQSRKLTLTVPPLTLTLHTDRRRLLQCILNLVSNAIKFTEVGGVTVATHSNETEGTVTVSVTDSGIGIGLEDQSKLFQAFSRIPSHLSATVQGTGLGIYLTKKIIMEILQGEISVTSAAGQGSCFTMTIPCKVAIAPAMNGEYVGAGSRLR